MPTYFITGAASGLGAATAEFFHARGAHVVLVDRDAARGAASAARLGDRARFVACDVTDAAQVRAALAMLADRFAAEGFTPLRGAVHCAGILHAAKLVGRAGPHDPEAFARVLNVNVFGTFNVLSQVAAAMLNAPPDADGARGAIVLTGSIAMDEGQVGQVAYAASKAAVAGMTLPAARELATHGIRVVTLAPGVMETEMMTAAPDNVRSALMAAIPFPARFGQPTEFAALAWHAMENAYLNGCVLRLDGAMRMP